MVATKRESLEVPAVEVERVTVHEGDGRPGRIRVGLVDLGVQFEAVVGNHRSAGPADRAERLSGSRTTARHHLAFGEDPCQRARCDHADRGTGDTCVAPDHAATRGRFVVLGAHRGTSSAASPTYVRGTRDPIRVTISYPIVSAACAQS